MKVETYGVTRVQQGKTLNEDGFLIDRGERPFAVLCDGAGNAERAAKRVITLFEGLFKEPPVDQVLDEAMWANWSKLLDSLLLGGNQSTYVGVAIVNGLAVGACVGDSRA